MAKDDYFVIVYRILNYLYECFKAGERPDMEMFGPVALRINNGYWVNVMESLYLVVFMLQIKKLHWHNRMEDIWNLTV
ncbi:hypothetical protein [Acetivibrio ethanolgignens]|uniref:hypothetical protein n=1 Tax=Acetivibrio ethanolgignens TaxID=290052 RepID=UPI0011C70AFD|nr:hypothetical protein [Acetivibrio ethanolgignens]